MKCSVFFFVSFVGSIISLTSVVLSSQETKTNKFVSSFQTEFKKIACVDVEVVLTELLKKTSYEKQIEERRKSASLEASNKRRRIDLIKKKLEKPTETLSKKRMKTLMEELDFLEENLGIFLQKKKSEIKSVKRKFQKKLLRNVEYYVKKIAKQKKYDLILEKHNSFYYLSPQTEITDEVLKLIANEKNR